ncbi:hypothetical protein AB0J90_02025 [Micromonospora sp. NPDC049523]|uniref:hypothetical protein n=1 Tax=Micromonospora sp. NPDC049523 TaxID=3155921 RepID=UPI0034205C69
MTFGDQAPKRLPVHPLVQGDGFLTLAEFDGGQHAVQLDSGRTKPGVVLVAVDVEQCRRVLRTGYQLPNGVGVAQPGSGHRGPEEQDAVHGQPYRLGDWPSGPVDNSA